MIFADSPRSTVGIEWELQLVDKDSNDLRQAADHILRKAREREKDASLIHGEMLLNTVELVTRPHETISGCTDDLLEAIDILLPIVEPMRIALASSGTHPFANPVYQRVTDSQRYAELVNRTRYWGRQMLLFGTHVHVGIEDRAKVLPILRAVLTRFAHMQALTASSPFWNGKNTGYVDNRAMVFQQLPTAGVPRQFEHWHELEAYYNDMVKTGVISNFDEVRWDVRPSPKYGTLEFRVCDAATNVTEVGMVAAMSQCLVEYFSRMLDRGEELPTVPPWFVDENKWRAARYGMDAILITDSDGNEEPVGETLDRMVHRLMPIADELGCADELATVHTVLEVGAPYKRLLRAGAHYNNSREAVVDFMIAEMEAGKPLDPEQFKPEGIAASDESTAPAYDSATA
ncbi:glutamate--cysteine ligase [Trueperella bialowiezensis]|uniref:Putative glutamate--cysteine ligase 2 n=1 Tax=Trueperella bialowiezensis TaxID=312285 RepID=A0A448PBN2_9ACTO|nr:glutamate--cysteine ligase [Trueperella bialowiezensis]VEI12368.1 Carboxylate-amine ligase YbdK [Trueperella bialowiezensis]